MHDPWHDLLERIAAAVLLGGGAVVLPLAWLERRGRLARPVLQVRGSDRRADRATLTTALTVIALVTSGAAGAIHLAAAPSHVEEIGLLGWGFVVAAVFQFGWPLAYGIEPSRRAVRIGIIGNVAIAAAWLWSRTVGLPLGPGAGIAEAVGVPDAASTVFELLLLVVLVGRELGLEQWLVPRLRHAQGLVVIALVPMVGIVFLATTLAVSLALTDDHGPAVDHGHAAGSAIHAAP